MMGLVVVFCVLISILGFYPAAALMIPAVMRLMDYRNYKVIGLTTVLSLLFIYLVFGHAAAYADAAICFHGVGGSY